jgi:uncharacterized protein (TIGR01777 family)
MKVVIAGGTGFLGQPLASAFAAAGHEVVILSRSNSKASPGSHASQDARQPRSVAWTPSGDVGPWAREIDGAGAVVNLAGASIAAKRWSAVQKQRILESRLNATRSVVAAVHAASSPPPVVVGGSAVGYYGSLGDEIVTEETPAGSDFLAQVCVRWEAEGWRASSDRTRVVCIRTGLVLERDGGALPPMLPPFRLGAGGPIGSGRQYWPWIHRADWVALVRWAVETAAVSGPVNATGPAPVTNAEFAHALGRAMHRPAFMPAPAFALRLLLGEMADALLLSGQRAVPAKAERLGFSFHYRTASEALNALISKRT